MPFSYGVHLLITIIQLETERVEEAVVAHLPPPTFVLPR